MTFQDASRFLGSWEEVRWVIYGVAQERAVTDPSPSRIRAIIHQRQPNSAYRVDRDRPGNDFEPDPEPDHTDEIIILGLPTKRA